MAAPRSTSLRALRTLSQQNSPTLSSMAPFRRSLHITGAHSAQPLAGPDITSIYRARSLGDLRNECERRQLRTGGSKAELVDRLSNHDILQTRAFSIAMRRIDRQAFSSGSSKQTPTRHFNTSRSNKSVNDTSTVDFAYMPSLETAEPVTNNSPRVPVLPDQYTHYEQTSTTATAMKPEIYTVGDLGSNISGPSPMSEVVDNEAIDINPYDLTETVGRSRNAAEISKSPYYDGSVKGLVKDMWSGLLGDFRAPKPSTSGPRQ